MYHVQLLIFFSILILSAADVNNFVVSDSHVVMTVTLNDNECKLSDGNLTSVSSNSPNFNIIRKMISHNVQHPLCIIDESRGSYSTIRCYCRRFFLSECLNIAAMGESLYQWTRDQDTVRSHFNTMSASDQKIECALKGFHEARKRISQTSDVKFKVDLNACSDRFQFTRDTITVPARKPLELSCPCDPDSVIFHVYCKQEYCFHKQKPLSFYLKINARLQHMINRNVWPTIFDSNLTDTRNESLKCILTGFRETVSRKAFRRITYPNSNSTVARSVSPFSMLSIADIGDGRIIPKIEDRTIEMSIPHIHFAAWGVMGLLTLPFILICLISTVSCSSGYRSELQHFSGPYLEDIEAKLSEKTGAVLVPKEKSKSHIEHMNVTTTSQMGNHTDLGTEGTTNSVKVAAKAKSIEEMRKELAM